MHLKKILCNGGNASGKPCAIGSVGFPWLKTRRRRPRSFLLHESSQRETESPLRAHYNPRAASHEQSRRFPWQIPPALIFFCSVYFIGQSPSRIGHTKRRGSLIPIRHSKQATLYTAFSHRISGFTPVSRQFLRCPPSWVSTEIGTGFACRCKPPKNLNSQQQPQFGQKKPSPETSSICPSAIFYPRLRVGGIWLEYCTTIYIYYRQMQKICQI